MTVEEIKDCVDRFAFASKVLYDCGVHGIQLHAAVSVNLHLALATC